MHLTWTLLEYPDNCSIATILYFSGCDRYCKGCQNIELQKDEDKSISFDILIEDIIDYCKRSKTNKIVLCGGDPLYFKNISLTEKILKELGNFYDICIYTGANIKEVKKLNLQGFKYIKCGIFDESKFIGSEKTDDFIQFATSNQELYDSDLNLLSKDGVYYYDGRNKETIKSKF